MKHLGDITKLNGAEIPVVDCITGGSPCQDLSIAGKRAGLAGERSGLFMEQMRIVKEMREEDKKRGRTGQFIRPRYMVWENVPGAFSSNKGKDFAAVLEETVRVVCPEAPPVPVPEKGWPKSGCLYDDLGRWSVAWRVHDAQFWGVPQRRKRIALVADFGGLAAPEVLFERKGLSWHPDESGTEGQGTAPRTESGTLGAISFQERGGKPGGGKGILIQEERTGALSTLNNQSVLCLQGNMIDRDVKMNGIGVSEEPMYSLNTVDRHGVLCLNDQGGSVMGVSEDVVGSLRAQEHGHQPVVCAGFDHSMGAKAGNIGYEEERAPTLNAQKNMSVYDARGNGDGAVACTITGDHQNRVTDYTALAVDVRNLNETEELSGTLQSKNNGGYSLNYQNPIRLKKAVRRLTPLECERLQGYPDKWTDIGEWVDSKGKKHKESSDTARYKALGNSIALPFWFYLLRRISAQYERPATLGSLFDGISGFPACWAKVNGPQNCLWSSEVEEFPIAVCRKHFGDEDSGMEGDYYEAILGRDKKKNV